jgi:hypothetical protein
MEIEYCSLCSNIAVWKEEDILLCAECLQLIDNNMENTNPSDSLADSQIHNPFNIMTDGRNGYAFSIIIDNQNSSQILDYCIPSSVQTILLQL